MTVPIWPEFPSEATVEQLTNHFILEQLGSKRAWLYSPTRNQEKQLGFDARSMNAKTLVIQYKRIIRVNSDQGVSFGINSTQHGVLKARFPKRPHPYVFFAFSTYPDYGSLDADFQTKGAPTFFGRSLFVDVWDVPDAVQTIRWFVAQGVRYWAKGYGPVIPVLTGFEVLARLKECTAGVVASRADAPSSEALARRLVEGADPGRLNVIYWERTP